MSKDLFEPTTLAIASILAGSWSLGKKEEHAVGLDKKEAIEYDETSIHHCSPQPGIDWFVVKYDEDRDGIHHHFSHNISNKKLRLRYLLVEVLDGEFYTEWEKTEGVGNAVLEIPDGHMGRKSLIRKIEEGVLSAIDYIVENASKYNIEVKD